MSRDATVTLQFFDGEEYVFRLAWGQLVKLQESRLCGPFVVLDRLHSERWMVEDISEVIRLGFIGGGMNEIKAKKLVREYVEARQPLLSHPLAIQIIDAAVMGPPDSEELEKKVETPSASTISQMDASESPASTALAH